MMRCKFRAETAKGSFQVPQAGGGSLQAVLVLATLLSFLAVCSLVPLRADVGSAQEATWEPLIRPRIGFPAFLLLNENLTIEFSSQTSEGLCAASLVNELGSYDLNVSPLSKSPAGRAVICTAKTGGVPAGLYDLKIMYYSSPGKLSWTRIEPNSVCVRKSYSLPLRIFWATDVHINTSPERIQNFKGIVRLANFLNPDLVVLTGDVVDNPREEYFKLARQLVSDLEIPIVLVGGNHDHATEANFFEAYLAPWNGSLNFGPMHIATLDTGPYSIDGKLTEGQLSWLEGDLSRHATMRYRIVMFHHPMFDTNNPKNETVEKVYGICLRYGVGLILNGHMHRDIVFRGPVLTLVNPMGYSGGTPYTGIRILNFTDRGIDWQYAGSEKPIPLYDFKISFSQPNDGLNLGIVVALGNGWEIPVDGTLRLRIGLGQKLTVEGVPVGDVLSLERYQIVVLRIHLGIRDERRIFVYSVPDKDPPAVKLSAPPVARTGAMVTVVEFAWGAWDDVLGLEKIEMYYSSDNSTWRTVSLMEIEPRVFWGSIQLEKSVSKVFYYAAAWDLKGQKSSTQIYSLVMAGEKLPETPMQPWWVPAVAAAMLLVVVIAVMRLRTRRAHSQED